MGRGETRGVRESGLKRGEVYTIDNAPRRMPDLANLPRTVRYRLALELGFGPDDDEEEYRGLPAIQQASILKRMLREHDEARARR